MAWPFCIKELLTKVIKIAENVTSTDEYLCLQGEIQKNPPFRERVSLLPCSAGLACKNTWTAAQPTAQLLKRYF